MTPPHRSSQVDRSNAATSRHLDAIPARSNASTSTHLAPGTKPLKARQRMHRSSAGLQVGAIGGSVTVIHLHAPNAAQLELLAHHLARLTGRRGQRTGDRRKRK